MGKAGEDGGKPGKVMDIHRWLRDIDQVTDFFQKEFRDLGPDQLNWRPNPATWSIGQVIDHLIVINKTYFPIINRLNEGSYKLFWPGKVKFMVNFFGNFILQSVEPTRKRKMKTLPIWEPTKSDVGTEILFAFAEQQDQLKEMIRASTVWLDQGVVISSPANHIIVYKLERAFDIIVAHEQRHLAQARELNQLRTKEG
jgi:hypothetical protein